MSAKKKSEVISETEHYYYDENLFTCTDKTSNVHLRDSSPKNENYVINYSLSSCSKPVRHLLIYLWWNLRVRNLSDFIKDILIFVLKMNKGLTGLERHECEYLMTECSFLGIVYLKMKILSSFTHPQVCPNLYEFLSSVEYKIRIFWRIWVTRQ